MPQKPMPPQKTESSPNLPSPGGRAPEPLPARMGSAPDLETLDSGWGDEEDDGYVVASDDGSEDDYVIENAEEDEPDAPLPDERLDPVAYAAAKKANEERADARRERRRVKAEMKKARRTARAETAQQKQKQKTRKAQAPGAKSSRDPEPRRSKPSRSPAADGEMETRGERRADDFKAPSTRPSSSAASPKRMLSRTNTWILALAVVIFIAAAAFAAVLAR